MSHLFYLFAYQPLAFKHTRAWCALCHFFNLLKFLQNQHRVEGAAKLSLARFLPHFLVYFYCLEYIANNARFLGAV